MGSLTLMCTLAFMSGLYTDGYSSSTTPLYLNQHTAMAVQFTLTGKGEPTNMECRQ